MDFNSNSELRVLYHNALDREVSVTKRLWVYIFEHYVKDQGFVVMTGRSPTLYPDAPKFDILIERTTDSIPVLLCIIGKPKRHSIKVDKGYLEKKLCERYDELLQQSGAQTAVLMTCFGVNFCRWGWHMRNRDLRYYEFNNRRRRRAERSDVKSYGKDLIDIFKEITPMAPTEPEAGAVVHIPDATAGETNNGTYDYAAEPVPDMTAEQQYWMGVYGVPDAYVPDTAPSEPAADAAAAAATERDEYKTLSVKTCRNRWVVTFEDGHEMDTNPDDWREHGGYYIWRYQGQWYYAVFQQPDSPPSTPNPSFSLRVDFNRDGQSVFLNGYRSNEPGY